jgi:plasmid stabilization system protein ParE
MPQVLLTAQAHLDLLEIWEHVAQRSAERADRLTEAIEKKLALVAQFPRWGGAATNWPPECGALSRSDTSSSIGSTPTGSRSSARSTARGIFRDCSGSDPI